LITPAATLILIRHILAGCHIDIDADYAIIAITIYFH